MISIVQRVLEGSVAVDGREVSRIGGGLVVLLSVVREDDADDAAWMAGKLAAMRVFRNEARHFDIDVRQAGGSLLLVSNFTVAAATAQGRRPSFDAAAPAEQAEKLVQATMEALRTLDVHVLGGVFGADMKVALVNDGPATFILNSRGN